MQSKTNEHIKRLAQSAASIKEGAQAIKKHMINEEGILVDVERGFEKNQTIMSQTISKIDKVITSASSSIHCYVLLFVFIVLALLYKLSK